MKKIIILGCSGSGKSTLAVRAAEALQEVMPVCCKGPAKTRKESKRKNV